MKKIGIYAGTFDPIHNGHVIFAEAAIRQGIEKVFFLVEPRPRRKQGVRALEHRVAMASLAAANNRKLGVIQLEQSRFTPHETLPVLAARFKGQELVLLFGDDVIKHMVDNIAAWPHLDELSKNTSLLIAARRHQLSDISESLDSLNKHGIKFSYEFVNIGKHSETSASKVRLVLRTKNAAPNVPKPVHQYIKANGLYTSDTEGVTS